MSAKGAVTSWYEQRLSDKVTGQCHQNFVVGIQSGLSPPASAHLISLLRGGYHDCISLLIRLCAIQLRTIADELSHKEGQRCW